jgi:ribosomal protein S6--L-glutamate ligase
MNILILNAEPQCYSTKQLVKEAKKKKHDVEVHSADDFYLEISDAASGHDKIFLKGEDGNDVRIHTDRYDAIIVRITDLSYGSLVVEHFEKNLKTFTTAGAMPLQNASNKFRTCQLLSQAKIRTIKQVIAKHPNDYGFLVNRVGLPAIAKTQTGSKGAGVFILESKLSASTTLQAFSKLEQHIILQEYLQTETKEENAHDIRAFVVDQEVVAAYKRYSLDEDFRSNYSISGAGQKVELTDDEKQMAVDAANAIGLPGIAGVDLMRSDGKTYCIEVNGNPGLQGVEKVTGINVAKKIIEYIERKGPGSRKTEESKSNFNQKVNTMKSHPEKKTTTRKLNGMQRIYRAKKAFAAKLAKNQNDTPIHHIGAERVERRDQAELDKLPHNQQAAKMGFGDGQTEEEYKRMQAGFDKLPHHQEADKMGFGDGQTEEEYERMQTVFDKLPHHQEADKIGFGDGQTEEEYERMQTVFDKLPHNRRADQSECIPKK